MLRAAMFSHRPAAGRGLWRVARGRIRWWFTILRERLALLFAVRGVVIGCDAQESHEFSVPKRSRPVRLSGGVICAFISDSLNPRCETPAATQC